MTIIFSRGVADGVGKALTAAERLAFLAGAANGAGSSFGVTERLAFLAGVAVASGSSLTVAERLAMLAGGATATGWPIRIVMGEDNAMARQRRLTVPVGTTIDGVVDSLDLVRVIRFDMSGIDVDFNHKILTIGWAVGKVDTGVFYPSRIPGLSGTRVFTNIGASPELEALLVASTSFDNLFDNIFAQLQTDGVIHAGTEEDYSLTAGT